MCFIDNFKRSMASRRFLSREPFLASSRHVLGPAHPTPTTTILDDKTRDSSLRTKGRVSDSRQSNGQRRTNLVNDRQPLQNMLPRVQRRNDLLDIERFSRALKKEKQSAHFLGLNKTAFNPPPGSKSTATDSTTSLSPSPSPPHP
jgi:hypothetical protein